LYIGSPQMSHGAPGTRARSRYIRRLVCDHPRPRSLLVGRGLWHLVSPYVVGMAGSGCWQRLQQSWTDSQRRLRQLAAVDPHSTQRRGVGLLVGSHGGARLPLLGHVPDWHGGMVRKPFRCMIGLHRWRRTWDHDKSAAFKECSECGKTMGTGWPGGSAMPGGG
jgi:hypothetical protein